MPSSLTPSHTPFDTRHLDVGDGHAIYVEQVGRPDGTPIVFLHGGPGSGCRPGQRALFDPSRHRAILFDQRGAGRSRAEDRLAANTTAHLVRDIEAIRETFGIERWLIVGGSWGATLALAYAERHPDRVTGLVLRAVFLGTPAELDWAFIDGPRQLRPELLRDFLDFLPPDERGTPLDAYWRRILHPDPAIHGPAAWRWHDTERILSEIAPPQPRVFANTATALPSSPFFEAHYFRHACFLEPGELLAQADRIADIPGIIVQGRYDLLCPPGTSLALHDRWPGSRIVMAEAAGHAMSERGVTDAVEAAIAELARRA